jgi:IMP dehydrogenase
MQIYSNNNWCFDDILMVPQYSEVESRRSVDISTDIGNETYKRIAMHSPIIAAPMDTVCEYKMAHSIRKLGGLGIIHRYMTIDQQEDQCLKVKEMGGVAFGVAVGATGDYLQRAWRMVNAGANVILVDTANGHSKYAIDAVATIRKSLGQRIHIMAGNVATYDGFARLQDAGADSIRVGIGGGSVCTTRIVSGHGIPTLSSILDVRERIPYGTGASIVADGGIRNSGDAVKALAAGADAVMLGSYLAGTDESPGEVYVDAGKKYKIFRGMASAEAQLSANGKVSVAEGVETTVPYKGSLEKLIEDFNGGIGSGLSYTGVFNLKDLHEQSMFVPVSPLSVNESRPHAAH